MTVNPKDATKVYCCAIFNRFSACLLCGKRSRTLICPPCQQSLSPLEGPLCRCSLPLPAGNHGQENQDLCGRCIRRPPPFSGSHSLLVYQPPVDRLIQRFKHHGDLISERALQSLFQDTPLPWPDSDALCPLPVHWRRLWWRGFDQSQRLAERLAQHWQLPLLQPLQRQRATPSQQGLRRSQRERNLRQAFRCTQSVAGMKLILVDDVMTTGSSARVATQALLDAGAREVRIWTLARTLPPAIRPTQAATPTSR